ncbi:hypothetical protein DNK59_31075 [Pseudomonas sp. TKO26]|uniref:hypothetical protein n=1 Tax=unclassified Pseudomonas TaxID=196821 RepID=UPI000D893D88|nr:MULTISPECIES: hypothetical protein [unclassified Pseudomonas]PYY78113.1 hypothetical protein DNK62_31075 [Pseudomonas sp. TKO30]PYY78616.1 hypothetical protein DNK61_31065 [Pseudomonas sp. TKO29]PYY80519.1 hypothetical protein DNK59_31075 [Pseudomonas sp. TKO26]PYY95399.1 hypothetical protein DNK60_31065 [Pseudomonas sp. TKO14]
MSLDLHLEADQHLSTELLGRLLENLLGTEQAPVPGGLQATFPSGLSLRSEASPREPEIHAEDRKGCNFSVGLRCHLRIKGPEAEGHSSLAEIRRLLETIAASCEAMFILSFQYESTLYWRDAAGLHEA